MNSGTVTGAALSVATAGVWGAGDFAGGIATLRATSFAWWRQRTPAAWFSCLPWLGLPRAGPPLSSLYWGVVAGVAGAFGVAALYQGLAIGRMGMVAPVASVLTAILPVLVGIRSEGTPAVCN